jgi:hypothetical protein
MADDEVPSLVELGLTHVDASAFSVPGNQIGKLPRALPVWYGIQRLAIGVLPHNQLGFRLPSLISSLLLIALVFMLAARWRGLWFAVAAVIIVNGSQPFVYLAQVNRFYSTPLLILVLTLCAIWAPSRSVMMIIVTALLTVLSVLSHNVIIVVFVLAFLASCPAWWLGRVSSQVLVRSAVAAAISVALYFLYVRPILSGWNSTGNPTPVLVSFTAHAGVPTLALAFLGGLLALTQSDDERTMIWWMLLFAGSLCFLQATSSMSWNPRYFLFFMPAMWMLAAYGTDFVARRLHHATLRAAWLGVVIVLLAPSLLSHLQDGSRHDYRQAATVLLANAQAGEPILSDDAETISYYLPDAFRQHLLVRTKVVDMPRTEFFLVCRSNAWMPLPAVPNRHMDLLAEIYRRRYDEFSHILRVYRVAALSH